MEISDVLAGYPTEGTGVEEICPVKLAGTVMGAFTTQPRSMRVRQQ